MEAVENQKIYGDKMPLTKSNDENKHELLNRTKVVTSVSQAPFRVL